MGMIPNGGSCQTPVAFHRYFKETLTHLVYITRIWSPSDLTIYSRIEGEPNNALRTAMSRLPKILSQRAEF